MEIAERVAMGATQKDVATEFGVTPGCVSASVSSVIRYEEYEDIKNLRIMADQRLKAIIGLMWEAVERKKAKRQELTVHESATIARVLVTIEERRAKMFGIDAPQHVITHDADPLEHMTPEETVSALEAAGIEVPQGLHDEVTRRAEAAANRVQVLTDNPVQNPQI